MNYDELSNVFFQTTLTTMNQRGHGDHDPDKIKLVSAIPIETRASVEPFHAAQIIGKEDDAFRRLIQEARAINGPIIPTLCGDLFASAHGSQVLRAVQSIVQSRFEPTPSSARTKPVFHTPTFAVIHEMLGRCPEGGKILALGCSRSDAKRIQEMQHRHFASKNISVLYAIPNKEGANRPDQSIAAVVVDDFRVYMQNRVHAGKYDAIILPFSMGRILEEAFDRRSGFAMLRSMLTTTGELYGLFFDVDAVIKNSLSEAFEGSMDLALYAEYPTRGSEGAISTTLGTSAFLDYRITPASLSTYIPDCDVYSVHAARYYMSNIHEPPPNMKKLALDRRLETICVFRWFKHPELPYAFPTEKRAPGLLPRRTDDLVDEHPVLKNLDANRGRPFHNRDLYFLNPRRVYVTPKADGVEAIIYWDLDGNGVLRRRGDPNVWTIAGHGPPNTAIQVELVEGFEEWRYILGDVLMGAPHDAGYYTRMVWFATQIRGWNLVEIEVPEMVLLTSDVNFPAIPNYPFDGYVLNFDDAPPGIFRDGVGAARYIKHRYTREIVGDDGLIYEADLGGDVIFQGVAPKRRPDKTTPTSDQEVEFLKQCWTIERFQTVVISLRTFPETLRKKAYDGPVAGGFNFTLDELAYLWAPWREQAFETSLFFHCGPEAVTQARSEMVAGLVAYGKKENYSYVQEPTAKRSKSADQDASHELIWAGLSQELAERRGRTE